MPEILTESRASIQNNHHDNITNHHIRSRRNLRPARNGNTAKARSGSHHYIKFKRITMYDLLTLQDIQAAESWHERELYLLGMERGKVYSDDEQEQAYWRRVFGSEPIPELEPESDLPF